MSEIKLQSKLRDDKKLEETHIPAVVYGPTTDNMHIAFAENEFIKVLRVAGRSTVISLNIDGQEKNVLIHAIDYHPVSDRPRHVDFYAVDMNKETSAEVSIVTEGTSIAIKDHNGILQVTHNSVSMRALPANIPHEITIDISQLNEFHDTIRVKDLVQNADYTIELDENEVLVTVLPPKKEVEEETGAGEGTVDDVKSVTDEKAESKEEGGEAKK